MTFDYKKFMHEKFERRVMDFKVPQLKAWFEKGSQPIWKIQSLTGAEIGQADEAAGNEKLTGKLFESIMSANSPEVIEKVKELVGRSKDKPQIIAKRIYHLQFGTVPGQFESSTSDQHGCPQELAVRICDNFPILFIDITNTILTLSGQGASPGKSKPSGKTKK